MESSASNFVQSASSYLTFGNIALSIFIYVALQCIYQAVYYHYFHPLAKFPGPFWAGVTRLYIAYYDWTGQEPKKCMELVKQYGRLSCRCACGLKYLYRKK